MIFRTQSAEPTHPADMLGVALTRATGVLSALTACHDPAGGGFAVGDQFVLQAVAAIEGFINDARTAYVDLCNRCDLRLQVQEPETEAEFNAAAPAMEETAVLPPLPSQHPEQMSHRDDDFAPSYDDLLRKLTAAEVFASERDSERNGAGRNDGSPALLPLLKSLRHDLERYKAA